MRTCTKQILLCLPVTSPSGILFVTPASRHYGEDANILEKRKEVYDEARRVNPIRWRKGTRNWEQISEVLLNPSKRSKMFRVLSRSLLEWW